MSNNKTDSNITAPTKFIPAGNERYAYRRFGAGSTDLRDVCFPPDRD